MLRNNVVNSKLNFNLLYFFYFYAKISRISTYMYEYLTLNYKCKSASKILTGWTFIITFASVSATL